MALVGATILIAIMVPVLYVISAAALIAAIALVADFFLHPHLLKVYFAVAFVVACFVSFALLASPWRYAPAE